MADDSNLAGRVMWVEGLQFVGQAAQSKGTLVLDGTKELGGLEGGVRPMEALLLSLAGCTGMDVISVLLKKRQRVTRFWVNVHGQRAAEHPRRYERITLEYVVRGYDVAPEAVERSIELSSTRYCGVTASLNAEITHTYRIEAEEDGA
ncbi:MAG: OsmC family protein [Chloroflexota bacterium]